MPKYFRSSSDCPEALTYKIRTLNSESLKPIQSINLHSFRKFTDCILTVHMFYFRLSTLIQRPMKGHYTAFITQDGITGMKHYTLKILQV